MCTVRNREQAGVLDEVAMRSDARDSTGSVFTKFPFQCITMYEKNMINSRYTSHESLVFMITFPRDDSYVPYLDGAGGQFNK